MKGWMEVEQADGRLTFSKFSDAQPSGKTKNSVVKSVT